jgi:hypothetical protein
MIYARKCVMITGICGLTAARAVVVHFGKAVAVLLTVPRGVSDVPLSLRRAQRLVPRRFRPRAKALFVRALPRPWKRARLAASMRLQAQLCESLGSPLYARLLEGAARDVEEGGPCWRVLETGPPAPLGADEALPLRFMASVHRLVLGGRLPALAAYFPSAGGTHEGDPWPPFLEAVTSHPEELSHELLRPVQTNEVRRCAALIGGFLTAAGLGPGALRVLELGASAGLNLNWDRYWYEGRDFSWGNPNSQVRFGGAFLPSPPPRTETVEVVERAGCDIAPLDPSSPDGPLVLESFVWPDQIDRLKLLRSALKTARRHPVRVDKADACEWLAAQLEGSADGVVTLVFHSFFEHYLSDTGRRTLHALVANAARRATKFSPFAHLRMEGGGGRADVEIVTWPGGQRQVLGTADNQVRSVRMLAH